MAGLALQLLDASQGQPLQSWEFGPDDVVRIGRGTDNDVAIASPFVSRTHACLRFDPDTREWSLAAISQHGVFVDGSRVDALPLKIGDEFRLASKGPVLRVVEPATKEVDDDESLTISVNPHETPILVLDTRERDRQVDEIASGDYFQNLKQLADKLRRKNNS